MLLRIIYHSEITYNVLWLRADGLTHTVLFARLIVTTVMGRNFFNIVNNN